MITPLWKRRQTITIDHTKVTSGSHTDFPILLANGNFLDDVYTNAKSDGSDIRFSSDPGGATELAFEIVTWNQGAKTAEVWVKIPSLSSAVDTVIYVWYGNAAASAYAPNATYGSMAVWSNYEAVFHLQGNYINSVTNTAELDTTTGTISDGTGKIKGSKDFTPTAYARTSSDPGYLSSNQTNHCVSAWVKKDRNGSDEFFFTQGSGPVDGIYNQKSTNQPVVSFEITGVGGAEVASGGAMSTGTWYRVAGRYDGTNLSCWTNKTKGNTTAYSGRQVASNAQNFSIGARPNGAWPFDGNVDEVRVTNAYLSDGWLDTEYDNQNSPSTFSAGSNAMLYAWPSNAIFFGTNF